MKRKKNIKENKLALEIKRRQAREKELFLTYPYSIKEYEEDLVRMKYYFDRSVRANKPKFSILDKNEKKNYVLNLEKPLFRKMDYFMHKHPDDEEICYANLLLFESVMRALSDNEKELIEKGLMRKSEGMTNLYTPFIERVLKARRIYLKNNFGFDKEDVKRALKESYEEATRH